MPFSHVAAGSPRQLTGGLKSPTRQPPAPKRFGDGAPPRPCTGGFTLNTFTVNGFIPPVDALRHGRSRKPFRMRRYEKCACKCPGIRTYKNKGLKLPWNEYLQKNRVGAPPPCFRRLCLLVCSQQRRRWSPWVPILGVGARLGLSGPLGQAKQKATRSSMGNASHAAPVAGQEAPWRHRLSAFACV